jgi:hypothetical protein
MYHVWETGAIQQVFLQKKKIFSKLWSYVWILKTCLIDRGHLEAHLEPKTEKIKTSGRERGERGPFNNNQK